MDRLERQVFLENKRKTPKGLTNAEMKELKKLNDEEYEMSLEDDIGVHQTQWGWM